MIGKMKMCARCNLCKNQQPLLDDIKSCQICWVGLSAKMVKDADEGPLSPTTNSGRLISEVEENFCGMTTYKTNLVKCVPLDERQKIRYPNNKEIESCFPNLKEEISELMPRIVFLLGDKVATAVSKQFNIEFTNWNGFRYAYTEYNGTYYVPIHHPSYIYVYKRKDIQSYVKGITEIVNQLV
ncbi:MAG: uracil-DNA glycosylase family protein [Oscillospiraceae bacterium]|nr:uracil-DNA glycosylase family protein [Oscillospiraceae bacterium]